MWLLREKTNVKIELTIRISVFRKRNRGCQKLYIPTVPEAQKILMLLWNDIQYFTPKNEII